MIFRHLLLPLEGFLPQEFLWPQELCGPKNYFEVCDKIAHPYSRVSRASGKRKLDERRATNIQGKNAAWFFCWWLFARPVQLVTVYCSVLLPPSTKWLIVHRNSSLHERSENIPKRAGLGFEIKLKWFSEPVLYLWWRTVSEEMLRCLTWLPPHATRGLIYYLPGMYVPCILCHQIIAHKDTTSDGLFARPPR